jgi:hypothetical protein
MFLNSTSQSEPIANKQALLLKLEQEYSKEYPPSWIRDFNKVFDTKKKRAMMSSKLEKEKAIQKLKLELMAAREDIVANDNIDEQLEQLRVSIKTKFNNLREIIILHYPALKPQIQKMTKDLVKLQTPILIVTNDVINDIKAMESKVMVLEETLKEVMKQPTQTQLNSQDTLPNSTNFNSQSPLPNSTNFNSQNTLPNSTTQTPALHHVIAQNILNIIRTRSPSALNYVRTPPPVSNISYENVQTSKQLSDDNSVVDDYDTNAEVDDRTCSKSASTIYYEVLAYNETPMLQISTDNDSCYNTIYITRKKPFDFNVVLKHNPTDEVVLYCNATTHHSKSISTAINQGLKSLTNKRQLIVMYVTHATFDIIESSPFVKRTTNYFYEGGNIFAYIKPESFTTFTLDEVRELKTKRNQKLQVLVRFDMERNRYDLFHDYDTLGICDVLRGKTYLLYKPTRQHLPFHRIENKHIVCDLRSKHPSKFNYAIIKKGYLEKQSNATQSGGNTENITTLDSEDAIVSALFNPNNVIQRPLGKDYTNDIIAKALNNALNEQRQIAHLRYYDQTH